MKCTMESTVEVDNTVFKDILNMLICCINVKKSTDCCCFLLHWRSLFAFSTLVIFGGNFISSIQKPIYIHSIFTLGFSLTRSLYLDLFLFPFLSLSSFFSVYFSFLGSVFHLTPLAGVAKGGLMASLSCVLAAVLLQLLGCDKERKEEKFSH